MIVSASRREDMPKYGVDRILDYQRNMHDGDLFVFWTKDPTPLLYKLMEIEYPYYFQYTLVYYPDTIHRSLPNIKECISTFKQASIKSGGNIIWRYDPIIFTPNLNVEFHQSAFKRFLENGIGDYTDRCVVSIFDDYQHSLKRMQSAGIQVIKPSEQMLQDLCGYMLSLCTAYEIELVSCAEPLTRYGIQPGKCIDDGYIKSHLGIDVDATKDPTQRMACGCIKSVDIGEYGMCRHKCLYCYASRNDRY